MENSIILEDGTMMRRLVVLVCVAGLMSTVANASILADGDFESGAMNWPNGWGAGTSGTFVVGAGVGGSIGGQTVASDQYWHGFLDIAKVGGNWGTGDYTMTFQAKTNTIGTQVFFGWNGPGYAMWAPQVALTTGWATYTYTTPFPAMGRAVSADIFLYQKGAGTMTIDNVSFVPEPVTMLLLGIGGLLLRRRK
jgi:hypothetical protein